MRRRIPALLAIAVAALIVAGALASEPQQACLVGSCTYVPIALKPPTATPTVTATPTNTPTVQPSPTVTPTTLPTTLIVKSSRTFTQGTTRYVVGEVYNGRSSAVFFVNVSARFYDAGNALVAVEDAFTSLTKTAPGQVNPFKIVLFNAPPSIVRYDLALTFETSSVLDYQPITVLSQQIRDNFGVEVFGEVRNDQPGEMRSVEVVATFYDAGGAVVDTDFGFPSSTTLAPGATSIYKISTFDESLTFASYVVQAQGYRAP